MLYMITNSQKLGQLNLGGDIMRQLEQEFLVDDSSTHVTNIRCMAEDIEMKKIILL